MRYHDPLHVPSAKLVIWHNGEEVYMLNKRLLDQQNCWENLDRIKELHSEKLHVFDMMEESNDKDFLALCDELCTQIEFELQDAWLFGGDRTYHIFWNRPKCQCPSMDNRDRYPSNCYIINIECPLHGE